MNRRQFLLGLGVTGEGNHVDFMEAIRLYNPIMFDFALKRLLKFEGKPFPSNVFETRKFFA